jgi:hypothetical protein
MSDPAQQHMHAYMHSLFHGVLNLGGVIEEPNARVLAHTSPYQS